MRAIAIGLCLAVTGVAALSAADWPQWRGPLGTGVSEEKGLPLRWGPTDNVAWKADLGGVGVSSPIVAGGKVFVTSQIGVGISPPGPRLAQGGGAPTSGERALRTARSTTTPPPTGGTFFLVEAFDRQTGRRLWAYRFEAVGPLPPTHDKHNLASPSPVSDGQFVYAWFGTGQIVALDMNGKLVWQRHLGQEISPFV